jgi:hypothetical protein
MDRDEERQEPNISIGAQVVDAAGQLIGTVIDVDPVYLVVEQAVSADFYIPIDVVGSFDETTVTLTVSREEAVGESWETEPAAMVGFASTDSFPPGILFGGHLEEMGTTDEELGAVEDEVTDDAPDDDEVPVG